MQRILYLSTLVFLLTVSCKQTKDIVQIEQTENELSVFLRYSEKMKSFWAINFPLQIKVKNGTSNKIKLIDFQYKYLSDKQGTFPKIYVFSESKLSQVNSMNNVVKPNETKEYLLYTKHFIDTAKYNNRFFFESSAILDEENIDSVNLGRLIKFKSKYPSLSAELMKKDSLILHMYDVENKKFIYMGAEIKW